MNSRIGNTTRNNEANLLDRFTATDVIVAASLAIAFLTFLTLSKIAIV